MDAARGSSVTSVLVDEFSLGKGLQGQTTQQHGRRVTGELTSTYSRGKMPILSPSMPSAQLSSTLRITVKTSS